MRSDVRWDFAVPPHPCPLFVHCSLCVGGGGITARGRAPRRFHLFWLTVENFQMVIFFHLQKAHQFSQIHCSLGSMEICKTSHLVAPPYPVHWFIARCVGGVGVGGCARLPEPACCGRRPTCAPELDP